MGCCQSCAWCCRSCREEGCWRGTCGCIADHDISFNKCMSVVPWWPIVSILITIISFSFILEGLRLVTSTVGIQLDPLIIQLTVASGAVLVLVNLVFAYSVCSNKLRIHN